MSCNRNRGNEIDKMKMFDIISKISAKVAEIEGKQPIEENSARTY